MEEARREATEVSARVQELATYYARGGYITDPALSDETVGALARGYYDGYLACASARDRLRDELSEALAKSLHGMFVVHENGWGECRLCGVSVAPGERDWHHATCPVPIARDALNRSRTILGRI